MARRPTTRRHDSHPGRPQRIEALESRLLMATYEFGNPSQINVYNDFTTPTPAFLYPSSATVKGVTGTITDIRVTLRNFSHERPYDIDVLLVAPNGRSVMLMSDVGGVLPTNDVTLTVSDTATTPMPESGPLVTRTYRPTDYENDEPLPSTPFDAPSHTRLIDLAAGDVNDLWHLYVVDDEFGAEGGFIGGWGLTITTGGTGPAAPSTPDLHRNSDSGLSTTDDITRINTPVFTGTATAGTQVRLYVDGNPVGTGPIQPGGVWNVQVQGISEGQRSISARAMDAEGNEGASSGELLVTFDYTPPGSPPAPDMAPESDPDGDDVTSDSTPTFTGNATGGPTVQVIATAIPSGNVIALGSATPDASGNYSVTPTTALAPGRYEIKTAVVDAAGNGSDPSAPLEITVQQSTAEAPRVTAVYLNSTGWSDDFRNELVEENIGHAGFGYRVPGGADQLLALPWVNVNVITIEFSRDVSVQADDLLVLSGLPGVTYGLATSGALPFQYNPATRTATWRLDKPLANFTTTNRRVADRVRLVLDADAPNGVRAAGATGAYLDGEWTDGSDSMPTGNGTAGGDMRLLVNVVPGDANRNGNVAPTDFGTVRSAVGRSTTDEGSGSTAYTVFKDVNANGNISPTDIGVVRGNTGANITSVTAPASVAAAAPPPAGAAITEEIFGVRPILV
jgi:hypothetical protein